MYVLYVSMYVCVQKFTSQSNFLVNTALDSTDNYFSDQFPEYFILGSLMLSNLIPGKKKNKPLFNFLF